MQKQWKIARISNPSIVTELQQTLTIDEHISKLLVLRGITNYEEAKAFFRPTLDMLHNPFIAINF